MSTAQDIIKRARRLHGSLGRGEVPTNAENVDDLAAFNAMLDRMWLTPNAPYRITEDTLTVSAQTHTIGASGDTVSTRPIKVESAVCRISNIDHPINILTQRQYRAIAAKQVTSTIVTDLWYDPTSTNGTVYLWPVPSSSLTVLIRSRARIESLTINETLTLPPGYEEMLAYELSIVLAPEYQRGVPDSVAVVAANSRRQLKRLNHQTAQANLEMGGRYNINADTFH